MNTRESLIYRCLRGEATAHEMAEMEGWVAGSDENRALWNQIRDLEGLTQPEEPQERLDLEQGWSRLSAELGLQSQATVLPMKRRFPTAAWALLAAVAVMGFLWFAGRDAAPEWRTYACGPGDKQTITLADGSQVVLNAGSQLEAPLQFTSNERRVRLSGQAWFRVVKGGQFVVETANARVTVLGTQFDVWARNNQTKVVVDEGKVALTSPDGSASVILMENQASVLTGGEPPQAVRNVDPGHLPAWRDNRLLFSGLPLAEILEELARTYNVAFAPLAPDLALETAHAGPYDNAPLDVILSEICLTFGLTLEKDGDLYRLIR